MYNTPNKLKLDIIIIGYDEDKEKLNGVVQGLQSQLDKLKNRNVGVMFAFGIKEPNNIEEIKGRAKTMTNCEYFVFLDATESFVVMPNYIESILKVIDENESTELGQEIIAINGINKWQ